MKKAKTATFIISIVLGVLILTSLILSFTAGGSQPATRYIIHGASLCALVCALVYLIKGAQKSAASWFNLFRMFVALTYFATLLRGMMVSQNIWACTFAALAFGFICMLIVAMDLGKKVSFILCGLVIVSEIGSVIVSSINHFTVTRLVTTSSNIVLALLLTALTVLKYIDKTERNTK